MKNLSILSIVAISILVAVSTGIASYLIGISSGKKRYGREPPIPADVPGLDQIITIVDSEDTRDIIVAVLEEKKLTYEAKMAVIDRLWERQEAILSLIAKYAEVSFKVCPQVKLLADSFDKKGDEDRCGPADTDWCDTKKEGFSWEASPLAREMQLLLMDKITTLIEDERREVLLEKPIIVTTG